MLPDSYTYETIDLREQAPMVATPFHIWDGALSGEVLTEFYRIEGGFLLRYPGLVDFKVAADGTSSRAFPVPGADPEHVVHFFNGHIRPLMMNLSGWQVYHGSAVNVGWGAVVFLGDSGRGKSTLAAAFSSVGHGCLSDDAICLNRSETGEYLLTPIDLSIRLRPESVGALVEPDSETLRMDAPFFGKSRLRASDEFAFGNGPTPLRAAFFLGEQDVPDIRIAPFLGAQAHVEWATASFMLDVAGGPALARQFTEVSELLERIPSFTLDYPRDYDRLEDVRAAVIRTIDQIQQRSELPLRHSTAKAQARLHES